jgi:pre-mRNA-splicing factor 18
MKAQITKSKPAAASGGGGDSDKKYLKRSEVEAQREAAYLAQQKADEQARLEKLVKKRKLEDETAERNREREEKRRRLAEESARRREEEEEAEERERRKRLGLPELPPKNKNQEEPLAEGEEDVEEKILVEKLREMGEPVMLFGESHRERLKRYRRLTGEDKEPVLTKGPIPTYLELVPEADMKVKLQVPKDAAGRKFLFRQLASYFTMVLKAWEIAMAMRTDEVKASYSGKAATNAMVQARENLRPFFKKLEKGDLEDSILEPVVEIVHSAQERRYVDANDGYLRLSIGKA